MSSAGTLKITTPSDREIVMTRIFDARRQLVFDALVEESTAAAIVTPVEEHSVWEGGRIVTYTHVQTDDLTTAEGDWYNAAEVEKSIGNITDGLGNLGFAFVDTNLFFPRDI